AAAGSSISVPAGVSVTEYRVGSPAWAAAGTENASVAGPAIEASATAIMIFRIIFLPSCIRVASHGRLPRDLLVDLPEKGAAVRSQCLHPAAVAKRHKRSGGLAVGDDLDRPPFGNAA